MQHALKDFRASWLIAAAVLAGIVIAPSSAAWAAKAPTNEQSDIRLQLDQATLDEETGKSDEAAAIISRLKAKYPNNPDVLAAEADLSTGPSRVESRAADMSDLCMPKTLDVNSMNLLMNDHLQSGSVCGDYNRRLTSEAVEQITSISGAVPFMGSWGINYDFENDHINSTQPFLRANGTTQGFYGTRQQGTVMLHKTFSNGNVAGLSVFSNDDTVGAGGQYVVRDRWGGTGISASFNEPTWDYIETSVEYGTKDQIHLQRRQNFGPNLEASLSAGYTHYALKDLWSAANAPGFNFVLDYSHPVSIFDQAPDALTGWSRDNLVLGAHYAVDAEYFTDVSRRRERDTAGDTFNALPATTYEVHSFIASASKTILPNVDARIEGGYGVNRISGSSGPLYTGSLVYSPIPHLGIDVHASRDMLGGQNNGEKEDVVGGSIKWLW